MSVNRRNGEPAKKMNILEEIISHKKIEVEKAKDKLPLDKLKKIAKRIDKRIFYQSIKNKVNKKEIALITEIKKASPSKGVIKEDFNHLEIAQAYQNGGATCLSVLTDKKYFQGDINYIKEIKEIVDLPILRKDFIIDPYQIYESIYYQADCVLLIVGATSRPSLLRDLYEITGENEIDVLIEIHDEREMEIALNVVETCHGISLLGINNRDLKTFETNLNTTKNLVSKYKRDLKDKIVVSESGIFTKKDIKSLQEQTVYAFLVGEGLIKNKDIQKATRELVSLTG